MYYEKERISSVGPKQICMNKIGSVDLDCKSEKLNQFRS